MSSQQLPRLANTPTNPDTSKPDQRMDRAEFRKQTAVYVAVTAIVSVAMQTILASDGGLAILIMPLFITGLVFFLRQARATSYRLTDIGKNSLLAILILVPLVNVGLTIYLLTAESKS